MKFQKAMAVLFLALVLLMPSVFAEKTFVAENDIVVMEVESAPLVGHWRLGTEHEGYTGDGYYYSSYDGIIYNQDETTILPYHFSITKPGNYKMVIRIHYSGEPADQENDAFTRMDNGEWVKTFCHERFEWNWNIGHDINHVFTQPPEYPNLTAGDHTFYISLRSENFRLDRIHIYHEDVPQSTAWDHTLPETVDTTDTNTTTEGQTFDPF